MKKPLFSGLTILRPPDRILAEKLQAIIASGLPLDAIQMARILSEDAITVASILKRANNAYYGLRETVSSLTHAIEILEPAHVAQMVIGTSRESSDTPLVKTLLRQARELARTTHKMAPNRPAALGTEFTAGLLYNYGQVILALSFPAMAPALFSTSRSTILFDPDDWRTPEQLQFGLDAAEAGEFAARRLCLPKILVDVMATGGHPAPTGSVASDSPLSTILASSTSTKFLHGHGH
jgi:HD-like signal output (HDOD) protein